jgi:hypothetical protein
VNPAFNDDLDDYINSRKDKGKLQKKAFFRIKKKQKNRAQESQQLDLSEDDAPEETKEVRFSVFSFFRKRIPDEEAVAKQQEDKKAASIAASQNGKLQPETLVVEDDELEEDEQEMNDEPETKSSPSFIGKIFGGNRKKQDEEQQMLLQQQQQDIDDMKETIKILHTWLEKLPPEKIAEFKRSPDFEKYKAGLRKLGLIKE